MYFYRGAVTRSEGASHNMEPSIMLEDRRQVARQSVSCLAKIQLRNDTPPLYCIVTDTSHGGVRVHSNGFHVPDEFTLLLCSHGSVQHGAYRVIWRGQEEVGAKLIRGGQHEHGRNP